MVVRELYNYDGVVVERDDASSGYYTVRFCGYKGGVKLQQSLLQRVARSSVKEVKEIIELFDDDVSATFSSQGLLARDVALICAQARVRELEIENEELGRRIMPANSAG